MSNNQLPPPNKKDWASAFLQGYACCLVSIIVGHGISTEVEDAWKAGIGSIEKCIDAGVDEYDLEILKKHFK